IARAAADAIVALFSQLFNLLLAPVIAFYLTRDFDSIRERFASWIPPAMRDQVMGILRDIDRALAGFVRGQLIVCSFVGVSTGLTLAILGVRFAAPIGFVVGVLEIVPYFGPILGMIPAVLMGAAKSPTTALLTAAAFIGIQQVESAVISPKIMGDSVGLHPLAVIFALLVGARLFGVLGILLAVPVAACLSILSERLLRGE
ncbi:MAG: AI-2E family transporter, partial [Firmicutes bacterium]|nr:AI-2E family transporter [Bacillota bacterium]